MSEERASKVVGQEPIAITKAGLIEWYYIPVTAPLPLEAMFNKTALGRVAMPDSELQGASP